ncbi:MAG: class I SAM-dependent RNA methyltransferase [Gemmatimonadota bacterium]
MSQELACFAVTAPGLERLAAAELSALGVAPEEQAGGVAFPADAATLYAANLRLRTASRVLVRVADFKARTFHELERHGARVPWAEFVPPGARVDLRVSCRKSRLYHQGAVAERLHRAIHEATGAEPVGGSTEEEEGAAAQLFVVRLHRDRCTVSADASGALLHRRGYRQAVARAPLRETLGAAMLLASGWTPAAPLLDPMCGSGTLPIEAALMARRIAPGLAAADRTPRAYACLGWPGADLHAWTREVERARAEIVAEPPAAIVGSDRDEGGVAASRANAARAGVEHQVALSMAALSAAEPPPGRGWIVVNPPYGVRVGDVRALRDLYAGLGHWARARAPGWRLAFLSTDARLEAQVGIPLEPRLETVNGGIRVRLMVGEVG